MEAESIRRSYGILVVLTLWANIRGSDLQEEGKEKEERGSDCLTVFPAPLAFSVPPLFCSKCKNTIFAPHGKKNRVNKKREKKKQSFFFSHGRQF
jgi:hypothetical protein